jgi:hypothetical protein
VRLGIPDALIDIARFENQRDTWLSGWLFDRVITKPEKAVQYLTELQQETNSYIIQDGEKISLTYFGPPVPGQSVPLWTDEDTIDKDSLSVDSGYSDKHFNRIIFAYDYDEDGEDKFDSYSKVNINIDAASQSSSEWDEVKTKTVKSRWIKSIAYTDAVDITGVDLYHASAANDIGDGTLTYDFASNTLSYKSPGGVAGPTVTLSKNGKYQLFDVDTTKYIRVVVTLASLPSSNKADTITISALSGELFANTAGNRLLKRYRDPVPQANFSVDINKVSMDGTFIKPTDMVDLSSEEIAFKSNPNVVGERFMITGTTPDFTNNKIKVTTIKAGLPSDNTLRWVFIGPAGLPDFSSATDEEKEYWFIGDINNLVNGGTEDGYYFW